MDGVFLIDGKRRHRTLCKSKGVLRTPSGKLRSAKQLNSAIQPLWEAKREGLEKQHQRQDNTTPILEAMGDWIKKAPAEGIDPETVSKHWKLMKNQYEAGVGNHPIGEFSLDHADQFKDYLERRGLSPVTRNMRLTRLRAFLRWAQERDYLENVPRIRNVKEPKRVVITPPKSYISKFIERLADLAANHKDDRQQYYYELHFMELLFTLCTGVRRSAPMFTPWKQVYFKLGFAVMEKSKGGMELVVLPGLLLGYLEGRRKRYPKHVWLFDDGEGNLAYSNPHHMTTAFRRHKAALGFKDLKVKPIHGFRSNLVTVGLDELGIDLADVQHLAGHASADTTQKAYRASMIQGKRRAMEIYETQYLAPLIDRKLIDSVSNQKVGT